MRKIQFSNAIQVRILNRNDFEAVATHFSGKKERNKNTNEKQSATK